MAKHFSGNFTQQIPISESAIERAVEVMRSGRLHRYNVIDGETSETAALEREFADYLGVPYCLAVASGGYALQAALRAFPVVANEPVLTNGFTLSPVPGAIVGAGARPVFVDMTEDLVIDLDDLQAKCDSTGARILMLSHMRGHIADMDALMRVTQAAGVAVIEDCAHTMGARWDGVPSGCHGIAACYSTQTYKHINSGEGGFLIARDAQLMARATVLSGSYMLYGRHTAAPDASVFDQVRFDTPNCSGRMDDLRAAILRPQLTELDLSVEAWNLRYQELAKPLSAVPGLRLPTRPDKEHFVGSSIQFTLADFDTAAIEYFLGTCLARGVELKWFGRAEPIAYTSRYDSWRYVESASLPTTDAVLARLFDMRIPLTFSVEDCALIAEIISACVSDTKAWQASHEH